MDRINDEKACVKYPFLPLRGNFSRKCNNFKTDTLQYTPGFCLNIPLICQTALNFFIPLFNSVV